MAGPYHIITFTILTFISILVSTRSDTPDCSGVYQYYTSKGLDFKDITQSTAGQKEPMCSPLNSCCSPTMEENLAELSKLNYGKIVANRTESERSSLIAATAQFNGFFLDLLRDSQDELHLMFSTAYGVQYKQNEAVFKKLFASFEKYYRDGSINLVTEVKEFFEEVFSKMFVMLNPSNTFSDRYLRCVKTAMPQLKPFKDIPETLQRNLRQAFVAARTFVQGLVVGRDAARNLAQVEPTTACSKALASMTACPICMAQNPVSICQDYCMDVINGCLSHHRRLDSTWKAYIAAMEELAERLDGGGSFNIEHVMAPLKDMISDAIMEYQGSSTTILPKVTDICGEPSATSFTRVKRRIRSRSGSGPSLTPSSSNPTSLTALAGEIKMKLKGMEDMWLDLPEAVCSDYTTSRSTCWNGENTNGYGSRYKFEMDVSAVNDVARAADREINALEVATAHLNNAKLGLDVDWLDLDIDGSKQSGDRNRQVETTTIPIRHSGHKSSPDDDTEGSGYDPSNSWIQGGTSGTYIDIDTEDGDPDTWIELGSGDDESPIVMRSTTSRPRQTERRPVIKLNGGRNDDEGSGQEEDEFLIPIRQPIPDSDFNTHKFTYDGSGMDPVSYNPDDEDNSYPDTKLLTHEEYSKVVIQRRTTTEADSGSNSLSTSFTILFISILFSFWLRR